jgi:hypothetical protein
MYQITIKYPKCPQNIPNTPKIYQMAKNTPTSAIARPSKIYPNLDFCFEITPSGNPAHDESNSFGFLARFRHEL